MERKILTMRAWPQQHMIFLWQLESEARLWWHISIIFLQAHLLWVSVWLRHWLRVHITLTHHHKYVWCWTLFKVLYLLKCVQCSYGIFSVQLSASTQKLEELALKQSRLLIPVTPSTPRSLVSVSSASFFLK